MKPKLNLVDIAGLDKLSFWPLAIGWWIVIAVFFILIATVSFIYIRRKLRMNTPRYRMLQELIELEKNLTPATSQRAATELSSLIRRLALHFHPRSECASLKGEDWIAWLNKNDSKKFDWSGLSEVLLVAPFQETGSVVDVHLVQKAICAAKGWVV
jgi:hypothetical protein